MNQTETNISVIGHCVTWPEMTTQGYEVYYVVDDKTGRIKQLTNNQTTYNQTVLIDL